MSIFNKYRLNRVIQLPIFIIIILLICFLAVFYYEYVKMNQVTLSMEQVKKYVEVIDKNIIYMSELTSNANNKTNSLKELKKTEDQVLKIIDLMKNELNLLEEKTQAELYGLLNSFALELQSKNVLTEHSVNLYLNLPWLADEFARLDQKGVFSDQDWLKNRDRILIISSHIQDRIANLFTINIPDPEKKLRTELIQLDETLTQLTSDARFKQFVTDYRIATNKILVNRASERIHQEKLYEIGQALNMSFKIIRDKKENALSKLLLEYSDLLRMLLILKITAMVVLAAISLVLTLLINRWQTNWISRISANIERMSRGDFTSKIVVEESANSRNEFVSLSHLFNKTVTELSSVIRTLLDVSQGVLSSSTDLANVMGKTETNAQLEVDQITLV